MFSLPDIQRMNEDAARTATAVAEDAARPEEHICEVCAWDMTGDGRDELAVEIARRTAEARENEAGREAGQGALWDGVASEAPLLPGQARYGYEWFDIFSDDPKGTIFLCEQHDGYTGSPMEGYFQCDACYRVFIENYTWERYETIVGGECLCLNCARARYVESGAGWVPTDAETVEGLTVTVERTESNEDGFAAAFDPASGTLNLGAAPHVVAVGQGTPAGWELLDTVTLDASTGEQVYSPSYASGNPAASVRAILHAARAQGHERVLVVLDGGYQFAVSIGFYAVAG